ncbi:hypothetical protein E0K83_08030 [Gramella sp. BOM4]|nr:hypothetical protein [Christiangramia bathymodioli]
MKARLLIFSIGFMLTTTGSYGQIFKKIKKEIEKTTEKVILNKTEEKTEKTVEGAFDSILNPNKTNATGETSETATNANSNAAKLVNTEAKRAFYTSDVIVKTSDNDGEGSSYYFDSDEIAARGEAPDSKNPIYIDSEGFNYGYNESEGRWEKTGIMRTDGMAFMMPAMSLGMLKLPAEPTLETSKKLKEQGLNMNTFQIVEWAFIYKPEHFRNGDYEETTAPCPGGGGSCPKFRYTDPEYKGSWVLFDEQGRLSEIYANVNTQQAQGIGSYKFIYQPVSVSVPNAVEVKMPFQDLFLSGMDAEPNASNSREQVSPNQSVPSADYKTISDPNKSIANIDPDNPLSFPGVTSVLEYQGRKITMELNTETMAMKMVLHDPRTKPIYFDRNNFMYMQSDDGCMKAKLDLEKAFTQLEKSFEGKTLPAGLNISKMRKEYYKNNFGTEVPSSFPPVTGWPYIYNPQNLSEAGNFEKTKVNCEAGNCLKFTMTEGKEKGSYVQFDKFNRLQKIYSSEANGASITYSYPLHTDLKIPDFSNCQEIDINQDIIGNMMKGGN